MATTQSLTKSSHYVSVQQSSSTGAGGGTTSRYLAWSVRGRQHYFCSLQGILRIIEIILILIVLIMARVGAKGDKLHFGATDADFIGVGASIFLTITLLMFTVSNLIGHLPPTLLEVMTTLVGSVLMITAGALAVSFYSGRYNNEAGLAL